MTKLLSTVIVYAIFSTPYFIFANEDLYSTQKPVHKASKKASKTTLYSSEFLFHNIFRGCTSEDQYLVFKGIRNTHVSIAIERLGSFSNSSLGPNYIAPAPLPIKIKCKTNLKLNATVKTYSHNKILSAKVPAFKIHRLTYGDHFFNLLEKMTPGFLLAMILIAFLTLSLSIPRKIVAIYLLQNFCLFAYYFGTKSISLGIPLNLATATDVMFFSFWGGLLCFLQLCSFIYHRKLPGTRLFYLFILIAVLLKTLPLGYRINEAAIYIPTPALAVLLVGLCWQLFLMRLQMYRKTRIAQIMMTGATLTSIILANLSFLGILKFHFSLGGVIFLIQIFLLLEFFILSKQLIAEKTAITSGLKKVNQQASFIEDQNRFFQGIVHDLKSPIGLLNMLIKDSSGPFSYNKATSALTRIETILRRSSLSTVPPLRPVTTRDLLSGVERVIRDKEIEYGETNKNSLSLQTVDLNFSSYALCDPKTLEEILSNLINNAIQASDPQGEIQITIEQFDKNIEIKVLDFGIGFHSVVLENFGNIGMTYQKNNGQGIGINQSLASVKKWGGSLRVLSPKAPTIVGLRLRLENHK